MAKAKQVKSKVGKKTTSVAQRPPFNPGGTPIGWTFWNTSLTCWRMWFWKYVEGLHPIKLPPHLLLGSAYHGFLEGYTATEIAAKGPEWAAVVSEAQRLYIARMAPSAPPLPKDVVSVEKEVMVPGVPMSSKPDRIEKAQGGDRVREFKTANTFRETDAQSWAVHGEVIGEMMASGNDAAVVDIIEKKHGLVRQIEVRLTPEKKSALTGLIQDLREQVVLRMKAWGKGLAPEDMDRVFPKNISQCGYQYGSVCPYYERCWSKTGASHLYTKRPASGWRKYLGLEK